MDLLCSVLRKFLCQAFCDSTWNPAVYNPLVHSFIKELLTRTGCWGHMEGQNGIPAIKQFMDLIKVKGKQVIKNKL